MGTEHELLGLLADPESDASRALKSLGVTADRARERVLEIVPAGAEGSPRAIPFTPAAKKALELSLRESMSLGHRSITPGHVLLGLSVEGDVAMQVLSGLSADAIRAAVLPLLPAPVEAGPQIPRASQPQPGIVSPDAAIRRLLAAAAGLAVSDGRSEWGIVDFLESVADDEDASAALTSLGVDVEAMREAIKRRASGEEPAG